MTTQYQEYQKKKKIISDLKEFFKDLPYGYYEFRGRHRRGYRIYSFDAFHSYGKHIRIDHCGFWNIAWNDIDSDSLKNIEWLWENKEKIKAKMEDYFKGEL